MRARFRKLLVAGVVAALSVPAFVAVTPSVSGAAPTCDSTMAPVVLGGQGAMTTGCVTVAADLSQNPVIYDYTTARWHQGAIREFSSCTWTAGSTNVTCGVAQGAPGGVGDVNHSVTGGVASAATTTLPASSDGIAGRSFIVSHNGGNNWTLSQAAVKAKVGTGKFWIDNTTARSVGICAGSPIPACTKGLNTTNGSTTVTATDAATANFISGDVGSGISGECIPSGATILSVTNTTQVTISAPADCTSSAKPGTINGGVDSPSSARVIQDAAYLAGDPTLTSASAVFSNADIGLYVKGTGIPANAYILSVNSASSVELSVSPTAGTKDPVATTILGTPNGVVQIGRPSLTAPKDGDQVSSLLTVISLTPAFVPGSRACAANEPSGFTLAGAWYNPGKFQKMSFLGATVPDVSNAIGQIVFKTAVTTFAAYVVRDALNLYRVEFPNVPTSLANCAGGSVAAAYSFNGSTTSQGALGLGVGRPGTAVVRGLDDTGNSNVVYNNFKYTNEVVNVNPNGATSGTFTLNVPACGGTTTAIKYNDSATNVTKALRLTNAGGGPPPPGGYPCSLNVTAVAALGGSWDITFSGAFRGVNVGAITVAADNTAGGGGVTVSTITQGSTDATLTASGDPCTVVNPALTTFPCGLG